MKPRELTIREPDSGRTHHDGFHGGERLPRPESRTHLRLLHSGGRDLDGDPEPGERFVDSRKQHRADRRVRGRHALRDHLRSARSGDRRLVDRIPVLAVVPHLRQRWRARGAVHDSAASRAGDDIRSALSRGSSGRGGAEGRIGNAWRDEGRDGRSQGRAGRGDSGRPGLGRTRHHRRHAHSRRGDHRVLPARRGRVERIQHRVVACAARSGPSRRIVGRHGDADRTRHRVGDRGADSDFDATRGGGRRSRHAHTRDLAHAGPVHRRGRDRGLGDLHAGPAGQAGGRRTGEHACPPRGPRARARIRTAIYRRLGSSR